jgi:LCP family protein required for cell wall assembly
MPARPPGRRCAPHPRLRRLALRTTATLALLVLAASGVGHAMVDSAERGLERVDPFQGLPDGQRPDAGDGLTMLLIGTDSREDLSERERDTYHLGDVSCYCADTVMLLHLPASRDRLTVVSLPRDSYAELPAHEFAPTGGHHEPHADKLNAALSHGGPALMVSTVERLAGLRVDHYLELDFAGFVRAVDEVGGVPVCTTRPLRDEPAGLDLPAGAHTLDGAEALAYVRARHVDGTSDVGRMERQQDFLAAFLDRIASSGVLLDPGRVTGAAEALLDSVRVDPDFDVAEMVELAEAMREVSPSDAEFVSVPLAERERELPNGGTAVVWDAEPAERLFDALREGQPIDRSRPDGNKAESDGQNGGTCG